MPKRALENSESEGGPEGYLGSGDSTSPFASDASVESDTQDDKTNRVPAKRQNVTGSKPKNHTASEIRKARENLESFRSNIFKLQTDELLSEIQISKSSFNEAKQLLVRIKNLLEGSKGSGAVDSDKVSEKLASKIPFDTDLVQDSVGTYSLEYRPPKHTNVIGGFGLETSCKAPEGFGVDLLLVMPDELFANKDYLNYRYFHKRAFYLSYVSQIIADDVDLNLSVQYQYFQDDPLRPVLRLQPYEAGSSRARNSQFHILVHLGVDGDQVFPPRKLKPSNNAIREYRETPTPMYNTSILMDMAPVELKKVLLLAKSRAANFTDACKISRIWLRQRGFSSSRLSTGFGPFEFSILMAALLVGGAERDKPVLHPGYSSYQLFRATLLYLAKSDAIRLEFDEDSAFESEGNEPTLLFKPLGLNVLFNMTQSSAVLLRHEAQVSSDILNDTTVDRFASTFLTDLKAPKLRFDYSFVAEIHPQEYNPAETTDYRVFLFKSVYHTLSEAFGPRVKQICLKLSSTEFNETTSWGLSSLPPKLYQPSTIAIEIGLIIDPEAAHKKITYGPEQQEHEKLKHFKAFWGSVTSLRRFQDGTIQQAIIWNGAQIPVVLEIASYILQHRFNANVTLFKAVEQPLLEKDDANISNLAQFQSEIKAFQDCSRLIQNLADLPLKITSIQGISSSLRYTSLELPQPYDLSSGSSVAEALIHVETSGKWPEDIIAIEKTKIAFIIKIAEAIRAKDSKHTVVVGTDSQKPFAGVESGFMVIQTPMGHYFKFRISTYKDHRTYSKFSLQNEEKLLELERSTEAAEHHNRLVSAMVHRFQAYSGTARLLKYWFKRHLLATYFTEQAIELLALKPFLDSTPYAPPSSASSGFYRVLKYLSTLDWKQNGVFLDVDKLADEQVASNKFSSVEGCMMDPELYRSMCNSFTNLRRLDPAYTLCPLVIATKVDPSGTQWTRSLPRSKLGILILNRAILLARQALDTDSVSAIFKPSFDRYDVVLRVENPSSISESSTYKNLRVGASAVKEGLANYALEYFNDIRVAYRNCLTLFYTGTLNDKKHRSHRIVGIWNENVGAKQPFRLNIGYNTKPVGEYGDATVNKEAVINEILRLGGEMVSLERSGCSLK